ncbi:bis(5'-nucleosyl)-tetraphosphatase, symmetrical [Candidatus Photodesmus katoptron]|uniref:symmetrical bis(5'-nucleosyl)-tetraphosphatase n=1 Tax=Candidatus Photodesmus anomalopis TaxID=28176 RepID=UPI0004D8EA2C|nr:symmetrical bis(5'-nucleosyl)-tetraphosphatase [Candidatus Photodesmus katoptron]KEY90073.1 bis(5'-nucleosyl)-tetraphosphatase, symmetrical [Candidatus Photodesmus katoptron]
MSNYIIGDIQGCLNELKLLIKNIPLDFNQDTLWFTGDLVARGPNSLETLRFIKNLGNKAKVALGNHDLHLLAIYLGIKKMKRQDNIAAIFSAKDKEELVNWLRTQSLMIEHDEFIVCHAGISPEWNLFTARTAARAVEKELKKKSWSWIIKNMYRNTPNSWSNTLTKSERYRYIINAFTRMRFCYSDGKLDMNHKASPNKVKNKKLSPWFKLPSRQHLNKTILFGHWSTLEGYKDNNVISLDTGCVWGGTLTMLRWEDKTFFMQKSIKKNTCHV